MSQAFVAPSQNRPLAAALMLIAGAFVASTTLFAKALGTDGLGEPLHPFQITHGRFLFAFAAIGLAALVRRPRLSRPDWKLHVARSSCGFLGVTLMFASVAMIPLSDATAISFLNPIFAMMLAIPLLGERVGRIRWLAAMIALTGSVILLRPGDGSLQPGAFLALGAALVLGLEAVIIKRLAGKERPHQVLLVNNLIGLVISSVAVIAVWVQPTMAQWAALAGLGVAMAAAQACFVNAMSRAEASFAMPFIYSTLVFAALFDWLAYAVAPDAVSVLGAGVILAGAGLLAWREARRIRVSSDSRT